MVLDLLQWIDFSSCAIAWFLSLFWGGVGLEGQGCMNIYHVVFSSVTTSVSSHGLLVNRLPDAVQNAGNLFKHICRVLSPCSWLGDDSRELGLSASSVFSTISNVIVRFVSFASVRFLLCCFAPASPSAMCDPHPRFQIQVFGMYRA